eukprot:6008370-Pleurochrysis_carterae.AAC.2
MPPCGCTVAEGSSCAAMPKPIARCAHHASSCSLSSPLSDSRAAADADPAVLAGPAQSILASEVTLRLPPCSAVGAIVVGCDPTSPFELRLRWLHAPLSINAFALTVAALVAALAAAATPVSTRNLERDEPVERDVGLARVHRALQLLALGLLLPKRAASPVRNNRKPNDSEE